MILSFLHHDSRFTSREDIAERCGKAGAKEISPRFVSRCLKVLTERDSCAGLAIATCQKSDRGLDLVKVSLIGLK